MPLLPPPLFPPLPLPPLHAPPLTPALPQLYAPSQPLRPCFISVASTRRMMRVRRVFWSVAGRWLMKLQS